VDPSSFDAGAVCAPAGGDVCTAAATAKAAIKVKNFRIFALFLFRFRWARCSNANGKRHGAAKALFRLDLLNMIWIKAATLLHCPHGQVRAAQIGVVFA
jgi:hypothetical protein